MASIYDYPQYYDILFGWDRDGEADFYESAFRHHGLRAGTTVLVVCCATGHLALRLAARGWRVTGLDLRPGMLEFMEEKALAGGLRIHAMHGDMRNFASHLFDAVCCPMNSFRLLHQYEDMRAHLKSVAGNLRAGGVYVLDLFFSHDSQMDPRMEAWTQHRDGVHVSSLGDRVVVRDERMQKELLLDWGGEVRRYTYNEFAELIARTGTFEIAGCYPVRGTQRDGSTHFSPERGTANPNGRTMVTLTRLGDWD